MDFKKLFLIPALVSGAFIFLNGQENSSVRHSGAMRNVMWKNQLSGTISIDTMANKKNLYAIGPVEFLKGEITIFDGRSYKSTVINDSTMKVEETFNLKAPFFVFANVSEWKEQILPDSVQTLKQLEKFLDAVTKNVPGPFVFKVSGIADSATIHIVNLPKGSIVKSPEDAHRGKTSYQLTNEEADLAGFFSTGHQGVFTHHDSFIHVHLLNKERTKMGHLDDLKLGKGAKLFLPAGD